MMPDVGGLTPAGDVDGAAMYIDSMLKRINDAERPAGWAEEKLIVATLEDEEELFTGICTLIFLYLTWWRKGFEAAGKDVVAEIVPSVTGTLRQMTRVEPEAIPTMAAMMTAAAMGISPDRWRLRNGGWRPEDITAVQATALTLAHEINTVSDDPDAALRLIIDLIADVEDNREEP